MRSSLKRLHKTDFYLNICILNISTLDRCFLYQLTFFHGCKLPLFPFIFHFKKDFFPWTFSGNRKQVLKDKVSKWQDCISRDFYFKDFFLQDFFVSKFRTNFFQKTFLGGYHNCTLFIFINFHYRFLGLFFGIVLGLFWDCFGIVLGLFFGIVFWDYHPQLHP